MMLIFRMSYVDKGHNVEIWQNNHGYIADIKYPCGKLIESKQELNSKRNAVYWAVCEVEKLGQAHHHCENDDCDNNRYLARTRGL